VDFDYLSRLAFLRENSKKWRKYAFPFLKLTLGYETKGSISTTLNFDDGLGDRSP